MPGWIETLLTRVVISLIERLGRTAQVYIFEYVLKKRKEQKDEDRQEIVKEIEIERLKPTGEQSDEKLRELHRKLRAVNKS